MVRLRFGNPEDIGQAFAITYRLDRALSWCTKLGALAVLSVSAVTAFVFSLQVVAARTTGVSFHDPQPADGGASGTSLVPPSGKAADRVGWAAQSPQSHGVGLSARPAWSTLVGVLFDSGHAAGLITMSHISDASRAATVLRNSSAAAPFARQASTPASFACSRS